MTTSKTHSRRMILVTVGGAMATLVVAFTWMSIASEPVARAGGHGPENDWEQATGVWFGTTFLGDLGDPNTPKIQYALTLHGDHTALITASDQTGQHPLFPGEGTSGHGTWERKGKKIYIKTFQFADGDNPPSTFGILRIAGLGRFVDDDTISGTGGFDVTPCPNGPMGCGSPNDTAFPPTNMFVFTLERLK